jgi:hypothetical protein
VPQHPNVLLYQGAGDPIRCGSSWLQWREVFVINEAQQLLARIVELKMLQDSMACRFSFRLDLRIVGFDLQFDHAKSMHPPCQPDINHLSLKGS